MLVIFRLRDDLISSEVASTLAQKSVLWDLCDEWRVIPVGGELPNIDEDLDTPREGK